MSKCLRLTSNVVWDSWTSTTVTSTTPTIIWNSWNASSATSTASVYSATAASTTWNGWVQGSTADSLARTWEDWNVQSVPVRTNVRLTESEEDKIARFARQEALRVQQEEQNRQRAFAIKKADKLLESVLNSVQKSQLKDNDYFLLKSQSGKIYRIRKGRSANVDLLDAHGKIVDTLCAYPGMDVPDGDTMAAQKILLECDEANFLKVAIRHTPRGISVPQEILESILN